MTNKRIRNDKWYVKDLISRIENKEITKPKFQRKRKWDIKPKKENVPNERSYIEFLKNKKNSVHAITFGQETVSNFRKLSNIDGNNRINAIQHFMTKPFEIFDEYLVNLFKLLENIDSQEEIKKIFKSLSYNDFVGITRPDRFFKSIEKSELYLEIKHITNEIDDEIVNIQKNLKINGEDNFDLNVEISVNLFEGYNTDELCNTFEEINKYNSKLTETELLACRLHNSNNFTINNNVFKTELGNTIQEYYKQKSEGEVLECYNYEDNEINAHDFIVGFQNLSIKQCNLIRQSESVTGLSLFFKLWKAIYKSYDNTFTTQNVNNFIETIQYCFNILEKTSPKIFEDNINKKLFNKSCKEKLKSLKKNNLYMLISSIIGYKNHNTDEDIIIKSLEKCLMFHYFVNDVKDKNKKEEFKTYDSLSYRSGGYIENQVNKLLNNPENISNKVTKVLFSKLLTHLCKENNNPYPRLLPSGKNKNDKRRYLKFFEKTLMFYYYKEKIPTNMLNNNFSIEHICPNSSTWCGELDKDRTGNLIPILVTMNSSRGNKHIRSYKNTKEGKEFCKYIKDIIPFDEYDDIINHEERIPKIKDNELYNKLCDKNEKIYIENFGKCLFD
jgi:hypothetical protein